MKRVKIVRSAWRSAMLATTGRTRAIQGVCQGVSSAKRFCMSMQRCAVLAVKGPTLRGTIGKHWGRRRGSAAPRRSRGRVVPRNHREETAPIPHAARIRSGQRQRLPEREGDAVIDGEVQLVFEPLYEAGAAQIGAKDDGGVGLLRRDLADHPLDAVLADLREGEI